MSCEGCKNNFPIVNKKYNLCDNCNYFRLNKKTKQQVYSERADKKPIKIYKFKQKSQMRQQTKSEQLIKRQLHHLKSRVEMKAIENDQYYCWGCGCSGIPLDKSHILSVKHFKHLELEEDNLNLFCRSCHNDWESWDIERMIKLHTFEKDVLYVKENSTEFYNKIMILLETWRNNEKNI